MYTRGWTPGRGARTTPRARCGGHGVRPSWSSRASRARWTTRAGGRWTRRWGSSSSSGTRRRRRGGRRTRSDTHSVLTVHLEPRFGHLPVGKVTTAEIDAFYGELRTGGGRDRPLSDGSVGRIHSILHRALAQAVRWEWIWTNPAEHARPPKFDQREIHSPPPEAVARLFEASRPTPGLELFFRLAAVPALDGVSCARCGGAMSISSAGRFRSFGRSRKDVAVVL